jgi:hypothetical protein
VRKEVRRKRKGKGREIGRRRDYKEIGVREE